MPASRFRLASSCELRCRDIAEGLIYIFCIFSSKNSSADPIDKDVARTNRLLSVLKHRVEVKLLERLKLEVRLVIVSAKCNNRIRLSKNVRLAEIYRVGNKNSQDLSRVL